MDEDESGGQFLVSVDELGATGLWSAVREVSPRADPWGHPGAGCSERHPCRSTHAAVYWAHTRNGWLQGTGVACCTCHHVPAVVQGCSYWYGMQQQADRYCA